MKHNELDIYVLDPNTYERVYMVEEYESFVWTEKWQDVGDFELEILVDSNFHQLFQNGTHIGCSRSKRIMVVDNVVKIENDKGRYVYRVKGKSKENILENRVYQPTFHKIKNKEKKEEWVQTPIKDYPQNVINRIWKTVCIDGKYAAQDKVPYLTDQVPYPPGDIPFPKNQIVANPKATTLLSIFQDICEAADIGFRMTYNHMFQNKLSFDVYSGNDLTSRNNGKKPVVIFSPQLDNLSSVRESASLENYKNVAYIAGGPLGSATIYADGVNKNISGYDRRVLIIDESKARLEEGEKFPTDEMISKAIEELSKSRATYILDGEIPEYPVYHYGVDYELGDIVEMRNSQGVYSNMRVAEQTFSCDGSGVKSYPGLLHMTTDVSGVWSSPEWNVHWVDAPQEWGELR